MKTTATNKKIRQLLSDLNNKALIPRPPFQRRLAWANKHKVALIKTVLEGYPFPEIYLATGEVNSDTGEGTDYLVDGQQRITTLNQYFAGSTDLDLGGEVLPYKELDNDDKQDFLNYEVVVRDLGSISMDQIQEVFRRLNSTNYALNAMELHNATFDGEFVHFAEKMAQHPLFIDNNVFTENERRRMFDTRFALTFIVTMMSTYFNRDEELETYLEKYNDHFEHQIKVEKDIETVLNFINDCSFPKKSRAWKKADLLSLLVELHRAIIKQGKALSVRATEKRLKKFYTEVDKVKTQEKPDPDIARYYRSSFAATNDRVSRVTRGEVLEKVINGDLIS